MILAIVGLIVSLIPAFTVYFYFKKLRDDEEYKKDCKKTILWGLLLGFPVFGLDLLINIAGGALGLNGAAAVIKDLFRCYIVNAFVEELCKWWHAKKTIKKNNYNESWLDWIVFMAISALGFTIMESIVYMFSSSIIQILVRGITVGHLAYGLIMGYFLGKARYTGEKKWSILGFALPMLIHGTYNFSLSDTAPDGGIIALLLAAADMVVVILMMSRIKKKYREDEKYTTPLPLEVSAK